MDLFTVPTATLNVLYAFFVIHHDRQRILHFNATYHPSAQWVMQQLREAFPFDSAPRQVLPSLTVAGIGVGACSASTCAPNSLLKGVWSLETAAK